jgi:hypothetical protein
MAPAAASRRRGRATIMDSTISGNQALRGAGIDIAALASDNRKLARGTELGSSVEVVDCTIADNTAQGLGGGVAVVAVPGFGPAELRMVGSILGYNADRRGSGNCSSLAPAVLLSDGLNVADDSTCWLMSEPDGGAGGPLADGDLVVPDLMLEALADNGGPCWTHMPLDGSPVIDGAAMPAIARIDQRGFPGMWTWARSPSAAATPARSRGRHPCRRLGERDSRSGDS